MFCFICSLLLSVFFHRLLGVCDGVVFSELKQLVHGDISCVFGDLLDTPILPSVLPVSSLPFVSHSTWLVLVVGPFAFASGFGFAAIALSVGNAKKTEGGFGDSLVSTNSLPWFATLLAGEVFVCGECFLDIGCVCPRGALLVTPADQVCCFAHLLSDGELVVV